MSGVSTGELLVRLVFSLGIIVGVLLLAAKFARKNGGRLPGLGKRHSSIKVIDRDSFALQLARIAGAAGKPLWYQFADYHSSRPGHDHRYALDASKIAAAGWKAPVPLDESLERTVHWFMAHPGWLR